MIIFKLINLMKIYNKNLNNKIMMMKFFNKNI